ncbi:MAG TPA: VWA domain-containing protein, partial [Phototrophicaceae bacterium]|nr:VWA domain-containing protein [Phototrophicaceae bacterium]
DDDHPYEGGKLLENLLLFGRVCHALGMHITPNVMLDVAQALQLINVGRRQDVYHTMRVLMVTRQRDLDLFDEAFKNFWQRPASEMTTLDLQSLGERRRQKKTQFLPPPDASPDDEPDTGQEKPAIDPNLIAIVPTFSQSETLRHQDFADMTGDELLAARQLMEKLPWSLGVRKSRRFQPGIGSQIDLRRTFRQNLRYGGEIITLPTRMTRIKPRPLVLLCDISGSMERYTRVLLHFIHTLANTMYQVESFLYATHLTRITRYIRRKSVDGALREIGTSVRDWGGGTRTGEALREFNYHWGRRVLGRGAVVLLITDGWDRGDPDILREEAARLQRSCYRLIWLNPLLGSATYEPLTRGAMALLPWVDDFLPVHNLASLEALAKELWRVDWRRPERTHQRSTPI